MQLVLLLQVWRCSVAPDRTSAQNRQTTRRLFYTAIIVWAASFLVMAAFGTYVVIRGQQVNTQLCRVSDDNRTTLKTVLEKVKQQSLERSDDVFERNLIRQSFNELIALVPPLKCTTQGGPQELEP